MEELRGGRKKEEKICYLEFFNKTKISVYEVNAKDYYGYRIGNKNSTFVYLGLKES